MTEKIVGVIFGGRSVEHKISLLSAKSIIENIDQKKFIVFPIFIEKNGLWRRSSVEAWTKGGKLDVIRETSLSPSLNPEKPVFYEIRGDTIEAEHRIDAIFPVLHGTYGEDGTVQGMLELMGTPFVGASVLGSSVGMDKTMMKSVLKDHGLPVVGFLGFYSHEWDTKQDEIKDKILEQIGLPCFVKSADLGSSVGITKVKSENKLSEAIDYSCDFSNRVLVEKAVANPREFEVSVLGNENPAASVPGEIIPKREFYDYTAKYEDKETGLSVPADVPPNVTKRLQNYAVETFKALDCSVMGRVDFLMNAETEEILISEINTIPGFTEISMYPKLWEATGIKYSELITNLIELAFERNERKKQLKTEME